MVLEAMERDSGVILSVMGSPGPATIHSHHLISMLLDPELVGLDSPHLLIKAAQDHCI